MARPAKPKMRRDDWVKISSDELTDGRVVHTWQNLITGHQASLFDETHPMDNENAIRELPAPVVRTTALTVSGDAAAGSLPDELEEETAADRVAIMLQKGRGMERAIVKIWRFDDAGVKSFCDEMTPDEFERMGLASLRKRFGTGKYEIRLFAHNPGTGKFSCYAMTTENIAGDNAPEVKANGLQAAPDPTASALAAALAQMNENMMRLMQAQQPSATERLTDMLTLAKSFREAFAPPPPSPSPSPVEVMKEMMMLHKMMQSFDSGREPPSEDILDKGLKAINAIASIAQAGAAAQAIPVAHVPAALAADAAGHLPGLAASVASVPATAAPAESGMELAQAIEKLNGLAAMGMSAEATAPLVYEMCPDEAFDLLRAPHWWQQLASVAPAVQPHQQWYARLRDLLLDMEREDSQSDDTPPSPPAPAAPKLAAVPTNNG